MGHCEDMNFDPKEYLHKFIHQVPDIILKPIHQQLNQGGNWQELIKQAELLGDRFRLKDYEIAKISMAVMTYGAIDSCSERLIRELGSRSMTLTQLTQCLHASGKFESALLASGIKEPEELRITVEPCQAAEVLEKTELQLSCEATGFPYPRYTWFRGEQEVDQSTHSGTLKLQRIRKEQAGVYICRVHNAHRKCLFSRECHVTVRDNPHPDPDPPPNPILLHPPGPVQAPYRDFSLRIVSQPRNPNEYIMFSQPLKLECRAEGHPPPRYQWFRDQRAIQAQTNPSLYIPKTSLRDSGTYYCLVTNGVHPDVTSHSVHVTVNDSRSKEALSIVEQPCSMAIEEGASSAILTCRATGQNGQVVYKWFHNQTPILEHEGDYTMQKGQLQLENITSRHAGSYMCLAELHDNAGRVITTKTSTIAKVEVRLSHKYKMPIAKVALLMGNSNYRNEEANLPAVENDMRLTRDVLERLDFKVVCLVDLTLQEMHTAVNMFCASFVDERVYVLLYFAGHGFADNANQYLMPYDAPQGATLSGEDCLCVEYVHMRIMERNPELCVVIKDVCHSYSEAQNPSLLKRYKIPNPGKSFVMNAASFGEKSYETETGDRRGVFNRIFLDVIDDDRSVKDVFNRILEKFRGHLKQYEEKHPMHPTVLDDVMQHQRSLTDPIDRAPANLARLDDFAQTWLDFHRLPESLPPIEAKQYDLLLSTRFVMLHSNAFYMDVRVEKSGVFSSVEIQLYNIPLELDGPTILRRPVDRDPHLFRFYICHVQRLQGKLEPEMCVQCTRAGGEKVELSAPLGADLLCHPLVSVLDWSPSPGLKRVPTETNDELSSLERSNSYETDT